MGKGVIRIAPLILLEYLLQLEGYAMTDARFDGHELQIEVFSDKLPKGKVSEITPVYINANYQLESEGILE